MHITLETDYAIRIVDVLAKAPLSDDKQHKIRMDAAAISERTEVPQRFALKILRKLVSGGIVKSYKGVYGGYELTAQLDKLSIYDVIELVEGEYRFSRCLSEGYSCNCGEDELPCSYRAVFAEVTDTVKEQLKKQTFDKLVK